MILPERPQRVNTLNHENNSDSPAAVRLLIPAGFDPADYLPAGLRPAMLARYADQARYLIHKVAYGKMCDGRYRDSPVRLKANLLRLYVKDAVRKSLIERGAVRSDGHYIVGQKCFGYELGEALSGMRLTWHAVTDRTLKSKLLDERRKLDLRFEPVHRHLIRHLNGVEIDHAAAVAWLDGSEHARPSDCAAVDLIRRRDFNPHVCRYGRFHSGLTNLLSELRGFLSYRGERLVNLDVRNSQPLIFAAVLTREFAGAGMPDDIRLYIELCQKGLFYDFLMDKAGVQAEGRKAFKLRFFGRVFFCENRQHSDDAALFACLFPHVNAVVRRMKADDYTALACTLQGQESDIIINGVAGWCMRNIPEAFLATVHDSVVTTESHTGVIRQAMMDHFAQVGLTPTINPEYLNPPQSPRKPPTPRRRITLRSS